MRRYLPLFLVSFFILIIVMVSSMYLSGHAEKPPVDSAKKLTIYTTLPAEQISLLSQEYQRNENIRLDILYFSEGELLERIQSEKTPLQADLIISKQIVLEEAAKRSLFSSYSSEQTDLISDDFKDTNGLWTGLWYDPLVFAVNKDFLKGISKNPDTWGELVQDNKYRIAITDFLVSDISANLLYSFISTRGEEKAFAFFKRLHLQTSQYAKFSTTPVRMAGMGEADIGIAPQSDCIRYINDGFPITIIYPKDGTVYSLLGAGIVKNSPNESLGKSFIEWLLLDTPQAILEQNKIHLIPANPDSLLYRYFTTKSIILLENKQSLTAKQKKQLLEKWIQNVRFSPK